LAWGSIEISVVDSEDVPLPGIFVTALGPRFPHNGKGPDFEFLGTTDQAGMVHVDRLDLGETYQIIAKSESGINYPMRPRYVTPSIPFTSLRIVMTAVYGARVRFLDRETHTVLGESGDIGYSWMVEWPHKPYAWRTASGINRIALQKAFELPEDAETFVVMGVVNQPYASIPPGEGAMAAIVRGNFAGFEEGASRITVYAAQKIMTQPVQDVYCDRKPARALVRCRVLDKSGGPIKQKRIGFAWITDEAREVLRSSGSVSSGCWSLIGVTDEEGYLPAAAAEPGVYRPSSARWPFADNARIEILPKGEATENVQNVSITYQPGAMVEVRVKTRSGQFLQGWNIMGLNGVDKNGQNWTDKRYADSYNGVAVLGDVRPGKVSASVEIGGKRYMGEIVAASGERASLLIQVP
jgi:hypothetical protein